MENSSIELKQRVGEKEVKQDQNVDQLQCQVYSKRWMMLIIFVLISASNAAQWIQYSIIENIIVKYYNVSSIAVSWTSMVYMLTYIPLIFPSNYLLEKKGLKWTIAIGAFGNCLGAWIKVFSTNPNNFVITFIGQTVAAMAQSCILSIPSRLSAVWFGPDQVSLACGIGVFGNQLGIALGFCLTPLIVSNDENSDNVKRQLSILFYSFAIITTFLLILLLLFFENKPSKPPSLAQAKSIGIGNKTDKKFYETYIRIFKNCPYIMLSLSYSINVGAFYALSTLLNPIIIKYHPHSEAQIGFIGLLLVVAGMFGSLVCGIILDKTHLYKETTLMIYAMSLMGIILFSASLKSGLIMISFVIILLGFFMTGLLPVGFEFANELTYPEPEGTTAGILNAFCQVFGIIFTYCYSYILQVIDDQWANTFLSVMLVIGVMITFSIKSNLLRQAAEK